jgi:hypothetical protein
MTTDSHEKASRRRRRIEILKHRRSLKLAPPSVPAVSGGGGGPTTLVVVTSKAETRKQKNRLSAEVSRLRRQQEADDFRARILILEEENMALRSRLRFLQSPSCDTKPLPSVYRDDYMLSRFTGFEPAAF